MLIFDSSSAAPVPFPDNAHSFHVYPFSKVMSATKDYVLSIDSDANKKTATFTVCQRPSVFFRFVRAPLVALLIAVTIPSLVDFKNTIDQSEIGMVGFLKNSVTEQLSNLELFPNQSVLSFVFATTCIVIAFLLATAQPTSDSIMIMENIGIQLNSRSWWGLGNATSNGEFIPVSDVIDIVIHEGFHGYGQVIFYLCVLTRVRNCDSDSGTGNSVKVVFPNFLPRKEILIQVWKQSRSILYGPGRKHYRRVPGEGLREVNHLH